MFWRGPYYSGVDVLCIFSIILTIECARRWLKLQMDTVTLASQFLAIFFFFKENILKQAKKNEYLPNYLPKIQKTMLIISCVGIVWKPKKKEGNIQ